MHQDAERRGDSLACSRKTPLSLASWVLQDAAEWSTLYSTLIVGGGRSPLLRCRTRLVGGRWLRIIDKRFQQLGRDVAVIGVADQQNPQLIAHLLSANAFNFMDWLHRFKPA